MTAQLRWASAWAFSGLLACSGTETAVDVGLFDGGASDAGLSDQGSVDAADFGAHDAGTSDSGPSDSGTPDAASGDSGLMPGACPERLSIGRGLRPTVAVTNNALIIASLDPAASTIQVDRVDLGTQAILRSTDTTVGDQAIARSTGNEASIGLSTTVGRDFLIFDDALTNSEPLGEATPCCNLAVSFHKGNSGAQAFLPVSSDQADWWTQTGGVWSAERFAIAGEARLYGSGSRWLIADVEEDGRLRVGRFRFDPAAGGPTLRIPLGTALDAKPAAAVGPGTRWAIASTRTGRGFVGLLDDASTSSSAVEFYEVGSRLSQPRLQFIDNAVLASGGDDFDEVGLWRVDAAGAQDRLTGCNIDPLLAPADLAAGESRGEWWAVATDRADVIWLLHGQD